MNRENANLLWELLEDLYWETKNENIQEKICDIQEIIQNEYLKISDEWKLKKNK